MVVIGTGDPSFGFTENNIYKPAAKNPCSKYVVVNADHRDTDRAACQRVDQGLALSLSKGLP